MNSVSGGGGTLLPSPAGLVLKVTNPIKTVQLCDVRSGLGDVNKTGVTLGYFNLIVTI